MDIELTEQEVQTLLEILMSATGVSWKVTHPLIVKIGSQHQKMVEAQQRHLQMQGVQTFRGNAQDDGSDLDTKRSAAGGFGSAGRDSMAH